MDKVTKHFVDLTDNDHNYFKGDAFPREGASVSDERRKQLIEMGLIKAGKVRKKTE